MQVGMGAVAGPLPSPCHCGTNDPLPIPALAGRSTGDIAVCSGCGTVYVPVRRAAGIIAQEWGKLFGDHYKPALPAIKARQLAVAESIEQFVRPIKGSHVIDVGAGRGEFAHLLRRQYGAHVTAVEPSGKNVAHMVAEGTDAMTGNAEMAQHLLGGFADFVTALWTLENAGDAKAFVLACRAMMKPSGVLVIASGSRIMVPFKKPLASYITPGIPADMNPWRLSRATTEVLLEACGLRIVWENRWWDSDSMIVAAQIREPVSLDEPAPPPERSPRGDDPREVIAWFGRWANETVHYEPAVANAA